MQDVSTTTYDLVIRAARVVSAQGERAAAVAVQDGSIGLVTDIDAPLQAREERRLAEDEVLLPGLIDTHVHVNEPGRTDWEGYATATRAAGAGGITTLIDMPLNSIPPTTTTENLDVKQAAAQGQCHIDVGFWGGAVPENIGALAPLHERGVFGFKCFLAPSGVDEFGHLDSAQLREHLREIASFDGLMIVHAEDCHLLEQAPPAHGREFSTFLASRPKQAENDAIADVIAAARETGARVHILHLASAEAIAPIAEAKRAGVRITAETCPHYLTFPAEEVPDGATQYKCCPPLREESNRQALWAGLLAGDIDWVASDHSPCTPDLKRMDIGDFGEAWGGVSSVQLVLPAVWTGAREHGASLAQVVDWLAERPAAGVGLPGKGSIEVGNTADLVVFAPEETFSVDVDALHHKNPVSPYDGRTLHGVVRATYLAGTQLDGTPAGRFVAHQPA